MTPTTFGKYLRQKRIEARLSLRQVANRLGVSHVYLSEIEHGARRALNHERLQALADIIPGMTLGELETQAMLARPVQLDLRSAPPDYQDLGLSLAKRIQQQDLSTSDIQKLLQVLQGGS